MLHFYFNVACTSFRRQLIYRWSNIAGLATNIFFASIFSYVIIALYQARPVVSGYNVMDTVRYTWLLQAMIMVTLPFRWHDLMLTIRSGEVVSDLSKPHDFYWYWFSREMGYNAYYLLFRGLPIYVAGMFLFDIGLPGTWLSWLFFAPVLLIGTIIGIAYRYLYNIIAFWVIDIRAISTFAVVFAQFLTGSYVPVPLLPTWIQEIAMWLPFYGLMNLPAEVFLGKVNGFALGLDIVRQVGWLIVFTWLARWLTTRATRRVVIQGG